MLLLFPIALPPPSFPLPAPIREARGGKWPRSDKKIVDPRTRRTFAEEMRKEEAGEGAVCRDSPAVAALSRQVDDLPQDREGPMRPRRLASMGRRINLDSRDGSLFAR